MITVEIKIKDTDGCEVNVSKHYEGILLGKNLDSIETLVCTIKKDTMSLSEQALLELNQSDFTKKK